MNEDFNYKTYSLLQDEIKHLKAKCREAYNTLENVKQSNENENMLRYVDGCRVELENLIVNRITDDNRSTSLFAEEHKERIRHMKQLIAYKRGVIYDIDQEILSLSSLIKNARESKEVQISDKSEVKKEHCQTAKESFLVKKNYINDIIHTLYPEYAEDMMDMLAQLTAEKLNSESSGYIENKDETFHIATLLQEMELLTIHPYDKRLIKLAF